VTRVRTWALLAATLIGFGVSFMYWERATPTVGTQTAVVGWDLTEFGPLPHASWLLVGEICSGAFLASLLIDVWSRYRQKR
jgi:hypothetical protein